MNRFPFRFLELVRTLVLSVYGLALAIVFLIDSVDIALHPRATAGQFLIIVCAVGAMAIWTIIAGQEAPTADEKPFRIRYIGGIELHVYRDGTRVIFEEDRLVSIDFPDASDGDDSDEDDEDDSLPFEDPPSDNTAHNPASHRSIH